MSSFYDNDNAWSAPARQPSWEQQSQAPSRSATDSTASQQSDSNAFASQFEEIERATDNLIKSGKWYPGSAAAGASPAAASAPGRRESAPGVGRGFDYSSDPRMGGSGGSASRHPSIGEYDAGRPGSAGLQSFYQGQRFPSGRQSEAEQMLQAKRRMAAQRERELRNYHQEQQYNRTVSGAKSDRALSPATMSEEDRRELIARQHRALYGDTVNMYNPDGGSSRGSHNPDARVPSNGRGSSPLAYDPFGAQAQAGAEGAVQMPPRDRAESTASPVSNPPAQQAFGLRSSEHSSRNSNSSSGASPPLMGGQKSVAPIGTRPTQPGNASAMSQTKRSTTPLTPSSLSYGFTASSGPGAKDERSASSATSNPSLVAADKNAASLAGWGSNSAVWGSSKNNLAVQQPSVWG